MKTKNTAISGGTVKYALFLIAYVILIRILPGILHMPNYQPAMYVILGIAGMILSWDELKIAGTSWKEHPVRNILIIAGGYIITVIIDNLAIIPYGLLYADQAGSMNENNIQAALTAVSPILFIAGTSIFGPVVEETVFRNILTTKLGKVIPKYLAALIASIAFGMIHMHAFTLSEFLSVMPHIAGGFFWSVILIKTKNITLVYGIHILNNLPSILMMLMM
ncbi:MAG: CPBP family intramembrane metalloprotease [Clostridiales bacterium]|nr:CPBP family intramembrane metalloprotease [Clostridiales bacterium]